MGPRSAVVFALALVPAAVAIPARADIYECVDKNGSVHYSNSRPAGMKCKTAVRGRPAAKRRQSSRAIATASRPERSSGTTSRQRMYDRYLVEAARLYQLPTAFLRAVVKVESDFNPMVVSHAGAMGLMQLMPRTAAAMGVHNPFDPRQNIFGGTRFLRILANKFNGDLVLTIAAYNAGEGAVVRYRGVPPYEETRRYVRRVLHHYYAFQNVGL